MKESKSGIQVIARSAEILRVLGDSPQGLSLAEIAKGVALPRSTVQRIVCALQAEYLVESVGASGGVRLGPAIGKLFYQTQKDIVHIIRPYLETLSDTFAESVYLATRVDRCINVIDRVIAERPLRVVFPVGHGASVFYTAGGRSLLAEMPVRDREALLTGDLSDGNRTTDRESVLSQVAEVCRTGIARDIDEYEIGISALGVGLDTCMGIFSIGIVLPTARLPGSLGAMEDALLEFKSEIELRVGQKATARAG